MARPRIIIADTDVNYIIPLQLKFADEFFEKADLEIITDVAYFSQLFSTPQTADILIVSTDLYTYTLQKHNIGTIFLMTEQYEEEDTGDLIVNRIFKYTSIKEIFNEIVGKSGTNLNLGSNNKKEPQIIVVTSAAGGTGKTTVAVGLAACLTRNYKKVLYIDAEQLQNFQYIMGNQSPISTPDVYAGLMSGNVKYKDLKHLIRTELFQYLPPFKAALQSIGISPSVYRDIAVSARSSNEFDFVIIDTDSSFTDEKTELMTVADKVIIVTTQGKMSVLSTNNLAGSIDGVTSGKYVFVCNNFNSEDYNALITPDISVRYSVQDYIEHFPIYASASEEKFVNSLGMQKLSMFLL